MEPTESPMGRKTNEPTGAEISPLTRRKRGHSHRLGTHPGGSAQDSNQEPHSGAPAMFLDPDEVRGLTGLRRPRAQARALAGMGIDSRINAKSDVVVLRAHVEHILGMKAPARPKARDVLPNWEALQNA
jgi:hypothetical protein